MLRATQNLKLFRTKCGLERQPVHFPLILARVGAWAAAVLVDELDSGCFERASNDHQRCMTWQTAPRLKLMHVDNADSLVSGKIQGNVAIIASLRRSVRASNAENSAR
jgi:hypothetical protein